ncbi:amino acid ABC transporter permease/ATP-binding protein [Burkholderia cenocepacia]|uniref:amino acid ABC transporter permease/ATP-binding protein n=1 Tax=Burkholderia cenocepacia TaxID=95486 RepID=UPI000D98A50E|nr:amino acid ABC transporter permease/ATP-binding protein [Burkholderia cenocepacia]MBN3533919.1 amino acid ABC transporter permease/ATP-binding protein [Burkholderia cenocepacia]MBR7905666.1 amino acid ABC transporter permease/ATP-binding protein [Burkholderia cenocepacia]MBR8022650.1 amino acid ABC transporter permease/ATP-binding protein [Burkholderia cenocepacia]MBR8167118.1 amino acid ABC transporter permease/ATP-binding protein [Burkholderia cenocepacia]MBR8421521.1 amino acid ABC trans
MSDTTHLGGALPPLSSPGAREPGTHLRIVPARHRSRTAGTVLALVLIALTLHSILGNPQWGWPVFAEWFLSPPVLSGLARTLVLTLLGAVFGFVLGAFVALARLSRSRLLSASAWTFVWLFRSIPLIVLLLILNNLGYLYEHVRLGVPFTDIVWFDTPTTDLISPFLAAVLGLTLNHAAFSAEVIRGGILAVDQGQLEAAAALGLPRGRQTSRIVLPQAMRAILPTAFNDLISLAKGTSMVYVLAMPELFYTVQVIYRRNLEVIPLLMVATVWYLIILTVLSAIQVQVERHYARGALRNPPPSVVTFALARLGGLWRRVASRRAASNAQAADDTRTDTAAAVSRTGGEVAVHGVSKQFGMQRVLDNVSFVAPRGSVTVIVGPSGSGKSTLLRTINHLERVDDGFIDIDGELIGYRRDGDVLHELKERDVLKRRTAVGMVFQNFNLFPHLTVLENLIEAPVAVAGVTRDAAEHSARALLARVGLADKADAYPRQLSGGQQQRVAIARALALRPKVLLFDEPTSALDPELVNEVLDVIKELARSGTTLVIVTHEIGFAREVADNVLFMERGRIVEAGPPAAVLDAPSHPRTRAFLSRVL